MSEVLASIRPPSVVAPVARPVIAPDDLQRRLVWLTLARLMVALLLLIIALAFGAPSSGGSPTARGVLSVVLAILAVSIGYSIVLMRGKNLRGLAMVQLALDLAAWLALVYVTGGPSSPMSFFFGLSALTAALVLGARAARITAVIAIALYGSLVIAMSANIVHPLPDQLHHAPLAGAELAFQLVVNALGVLLVAALGGNLASRLSRAGGALIRAEASRAALAALYEDVLRSIPVALLTCSTTGMIDGANPVAASLFMVPIKNLLGTPVARWLPFIPANAFAPGAGPREGDQTLDELPARPRIAYRVAPLYDRDDNMRGGLVVIEDRSHAESLREAVQRAERLAVLGRLAAGMAHEIRNPLGAISGCVELVREANGLGDEDKSLLGTVVREVDRLNALVSDMLVFAKPRSPDRVPTDLVAVARDVVTLVSAQQSEVRVTFVGRPEEDALVSADPDQIRQVIWNLVRNAMQASPKGASVEVSAHVRQDSVELAISDRGPGIAPAMREKLFDVFYSERARGTGLGLAIVKQIADAHEARVEVRERSGGGSEFALVFDRIAG